MTWTKINPEDQSTLPPEKIPQGMMLLTWRGNAWPAYATIGNPRTGGGCAGEYDATDWTLVSLPGAEPAADVNPADAAKGLAWNKLREKTATLTTEERTEKFKDIAKSIFPTKEPRELGADEWKEVAARIDKDFNEATQKFRAALKRVIYRLEVCFGDQPPGSRPPGTPPPAEYAESLVRRAAERVIAAERERDKYQSMLASCEEGYRHQYNRADANAAKAAAAERERDEARAKLAAVTGDMGEPNA